MTDEHADPVVSGTILVQLEPYRERRRVRRHAAGFLLGYLAGAWLLPAAAELLEDYLRSTSEPSANGAAARVAAYTEPDG